MRVQMCEGLIFYRTIADALPGEDALAPFEMRCIVCGKVHDMDRPAYACTSCGNLLEVSLDIREAKERLAKSRFNKRALSVWRYRELIPVGPKTRVCSISEGGTPTDQVRRARREARDEEPLDQVRRYEPDGLVQGPRHDGRHHQGQGARDEDRHLRIDREHLRIPRGLRGTRRHQMRRAHTRGQGRAREARPGDDARRDRRVGRRQLRPGARHGDEVVRTSWACTCSTP